MLSVARCSIALSEYLHIRCSRRELIRGALLHDYFLYDWHIPDKENPHKLHGFYHPGTPESAVPPCGSAPASSAISMPVFPFVFLKFFSPYL